ncbi:MAG: hypothetical protein HQL50_08675 [Magnetococcales bacterium]|nr:hypothetical protein [Magnetococcales bacterium]
MVAGSAEHRKDKKAEGKNKREERERRKALMKGQDRVANNRFMTNDLEMKKPVDMGYTVLTGGAS